jgi:hypothetical protein
MTPEQYIAGIQQNRTLFEANLAAVRLTPEERAPFERLPRPLTVLVLTEDWCGDSVANLPIVIALARETGGLDVRILKREANEDIAGRYLLADGRNHIPTYVVLDERLEEIGHVIERPEAVSEAMRPFKSAWFAERPHLGSADTAVADLPAEAREEYLAALRQVRAEHRDLERREIVAAFTGIVERAFAPA